ncbi:hypothetical protein [Vibrio sp. D431a]|uniref:hypothetical protein n=1 Tax=Vibrio sp. D431a TaxID=2837388 RepID=UPI00255412F2|nr:hypothetical protein [Vibrio sp. D431a]MDK9790154.1 hypothetical protein [Vibrio sp. D431a]
MMYNSTQTLDGLVEFLPSSDINSHGRVLAKAVESMSELILKDCKSPRIPLEYAFRDLTVNVESSGEGHEITLMNEEFSTKQFIESLLTGLDRLVNRVVNLYSVRQLRISVPKRMPKIERQILFDYIDATESLIRNFELKYVNTDKVVVSEGGGVKIMAYT